MEDRASTAPVRAASAASLPVVSAADCPSGRRYGGLVAVLAFRIPAARLEAGRAALTDTETSDSR